MRGRVELGSECDYVYCVLRTAYLKILRLLVCIGYKQVQVALFLCVLKNKKKQHI